MTDLGHTLLRMPDQVPQSQNIQPLGIPIGATTAWGDVPTRIQLRRETSQEVARTTSIRQAQDVRRKFQGRSPDARTSHLIILSRILPGWVAARYWAAVSYHPEAATMLLPQTENGSRPKIRPLGGNHFGGGGILSALNDCTKTSTGNYVSLGQDFYPIWCLQCTVLPELIASVYKKIPKIGKITFRIPLSLVSESMTTERALDALV